MTRYPAIPPPEQAPPPPSSFRPTAKLRGARRRPPRQHIQPVTEPDVYHAVTPQQVKNLQPLGDEDTWTDIDLSALTPPNAQVAHCRFSGFFGGASTYVLYARVKGTSDAKSANTNVGAIASANILPINDFIVALDASRVFQYLWDRTSGAGLPTNAQISLIGYWT